MPVSISAQIPEDQQPTADLLPDIKTDVPLDFAVIYSIANLLEHPADWDALSEEEKELFKAKYRFEGLKMRGDIKDRNVPFSKETMDI